MGLKDKLIDLLPDGATEAASKYNGVLSYSAEWHALQHGLYDGLTSKPLTAPELPDNPDVQAEPHYYKISYVGGTVLQALLILLLGNAARVAYLADLVQALPV